MKPRRFAVLDRDGTVIVERNYLSDPAKVELLPGVGAALRHLREQGLGLIIVTNQSGVGRKYFELAQLEQIHDRLIELLRAENVILDGIYSCPHLPDDGCECRKPRPGLLARAAAEHGFIPEDCFVIGDKPCDIDLGRSVGAFTVLVRTGYGSKFAEAGATRPDAVADDLADAARIIIARSGIRHSN
jgi:D-glycero-D-manno-heptose 1,7-bisphosphate phosphatase